MVRFHACILAVAALAACGRGDKSADLKFDSEHSIALKGVIDSGRIVATSGNESGIRYEIKEQLMYTIGQFNGSNGVADLNRLKTSVINVAPRTDGKFDVTYAAELLVSWPRERPIPGTYTLVMPEGGSWEQQQRFFDRYGNDEHGAMRCLAGEAHDVSVGIFWYYYRPMKNGCPLRTATDQADAVAFPVRFTVSGENTSGKSPEYEKVWEDGRVVATAIFGKNEEGATDNWDAGISAYRELYFDLIGKYGQPVSNSLPAGTEPGAAQAEVYLLFNTPAGPLDVALFLVDGIRLVGPDFYPKYNERTKISDFVGYSGHSGLGANIRALARMGQFVKGQYQLYLVNGCDTFAYVDNALKDAHAAVNPGQGADRYFDIITNAMPSYFHANAGSNMAIIDALLGKSKTYRELLAGFDRSQRAAVTGEQDNRWPLPFDGE